MHYFLTGHTGFKGAWFIHFLKQQGHKVSGYSDLAASESLFEATNSSELLENDFRGDIRDLSSISKALEIANPEILIHFAAQSLVLKSYLYPYDTFSVNVDGTRNVLEAAKRLMSLKAILIITTDKVYRNMERSSGYIETDVLGGYDPYSTSKAMADLMVQAFFNLKYPIPIGIARAGNVIGGGDICEQRLIPDIIRKLDENSPLNLRNPEAVRPWQHVLDCLEAYHFMIRNLLETKQSNIWNVGPDLRDFQNVKTVVSKFLNVLNETLQIEHFPSNFHETNILQLNSDKLRVETNWKNKLNFDESIRWTANWYKSVRSHQLSPRQAVEKQVCDYVEL